MTYIKLSLLAIAASAAATASAQTIISINMVDAGNNNPMAPSDVAGITADSTRVNNWNNVISSTSETTLLGDDLVYDDNSTVGGTFQIVMNSDRSTFIGANPVTNDALLFSGQTQVRNSESITFDITDIPFSDYDIYVYTLGSHANRGGSIALAGGTTYYNKSGTAPDSSGNGYTAITTTTYDSLNPGVGVGSGNYVHFAGLSGDDQTLTLAALDMGDLSTQRQSFYGFQIVQVPEPSTYAMLLGAGVLLFVLRRRKR